MDDALLLKVPFSTSATGAYRLRHRMRSVFTDSRCRFSPCRTFPASVFCRRVFSPARRRFRVTGDPERTLWAYRDGLAEYRVGGAEKHPVIPALPKKEYRHDTAFPALRRRDRIKGDRRLSGVPRVYLLRFTQQDLVDFFPVGRSGNRAFPQKTTSASRRTGFIMSSETRRS